MLRKRDFERQTCCCMSLLVAQRRYFVSFENVRFAVCLGYDTLERLKSMRQLSAVE